MAADAASRLWRELQSGTSKMLVWGPGSISCTVCGNPEFLGWLFEARSWVLSSAGNRQPYRSERPADLAISLKRSSGSTPSARDMTNNSTTSTRR